VPPKFCEPIQGVGASTAVRGRDAAPARGYHARGEHRAYRHTDPLRRGDAGEQPPQTGLMHCNKISNMGMWNMPFQKGNHYHNGGHQA